MTEHPSAALTSALSFQIGVLGATVTDLFATRIAPLGLKPKHAGLLALLAREGARSQAEAAETMGVAPSLLVRLADQLQDLGAITRERDPGDRRRQELALTAEGTALLESCDQVAERIDATLTSDLGPAEVAALRHALSVMTGFGPSSQRGE
ncbi:MarR family transcriptional regulator [Glycomyces sp. A-F 0318]|uniref:MarR family winged helix-turn-helix transcriptional regulator n=1 Tax=Glycomyces amatae TaxID=2881355 RepID=UPI001E64C563|nr:MarR family transcriptional regulator [Glycomyces amatae]MCD0443442.1 MarR family transcriptional regulator [Glycomyces amatae]